VTGVAAHAAGVRSLLAGTARAALVLAAAALVCMTLVEAWQVFARYVLNDSPSWTEPVAIFLMNLAMAFSAAYGVRAQAHFGFFIGVHSAPPALRSVLLAIAWLVELATGCLLAYWGATMAADAWDVKMAGAALPQGMAPLPLCVGGALIALFALELLLLGPEPAHEEH
jgi:TRAP-type C4-dicarboxylate transport system permease small subunit